MKGVSTAIVTSQLPRTYLRKKENIIFPIYIIHVSEPAVLRDSQAGVASSRVPPLVWCSNLEFIEYIVTSVHHTCDFNTIMKTTS